MSRELKRWRFAHLFKKLAECFRFRSFRGIMGETRGWRKGFLKSSKESRRSVRVGGDGEAFRFGAAGEESDGSSRYGVESAFWQFGWYREVFRPLDEGFFYCKEEMGCWI